MIGQQDTIFHRRHLGIRRHRGRNPIIHTHLRHYCRNHHGGRHNRPLLRSRLLPWCLLLLYLLSRLRQNLYPSLPSSPLEANGNSMMSLYKDCIHYKMVSASMIRILPASVAPVLSLTKACTLVPTERLTWSSLTGISDWVQESRWRVWNFVVVQARLLAVLLMLYPCGVPVEVGNLAMYNLPGW